MSKLEIINFGYPGITKLWTYVECILNSNYIRDPLMIGQV